MMQLTEDHGNVLIKGVVTYSRLFEALKGMYEVEDDDSVWEIFNQKYDPIEDVVCALRLLYARPAPPVAALRLPDEKSTDIDYAYYPLTKARHEGWNACLAEVKRINATAPAEEKE